MADSPFFTRAEIEEHFTLPMTTTVFVVVGHNWSGYLHPPAAFAARADADAYIATRRDRMNLSSNGNSVWVEEVPLNDPDAEVDWT